jgi:hypothetical protein
VTEDGQHYSLDSATRFTILLGAWQLADARRAFLPAAFETRCFRRPPCTPSANTRLIILLSHPESIWTDADAGPLPAIDFLQSGMCTECALPASRNWETRRAAIWQDLPSYFSLPPWDELIEATHDRANAEE